MFSLLCCVRAVLFIASRVHVRSRVIGRQGSHARSKFIEADLRRCETDVRGHAGDVAGHAVHAWETLGDVWQTSVDVGEMFWNVGETTGGMGDMLRMPRGVCETSGDVRATSEDV